MQPSDYYSKVKHPNHYNRGKIEVIKAMEAMSPEEFRGYLRGSALKYIFRLGSKDDPQQDGEKAKTYIDWLIETYQHDETTIKGTLLDGIKDKQPQKSFEEIKNMSEKEKFDILRKHYGM